MIPGLTTKLSEETLASADTIDPKSDLVNVTGTTSIATITPHFGGGFSGMLVLVPLDGSVTLTTTGNIAVVHTMAQNKATLLVYSKKNNKFYPHALS